MANKTALSLEELLENFWLRIIPEKDEVFTDAMEANDFEKTETGKLFSLEVQESNEDEEFGNASGDCLYVDNVKELLTAFNEKLENGDYAVEEEEESAPESAGSEGTE